MKPNKLDPRPGICPFCGEDVEHVEDNDEGNGRVQGTYSCGHCKILLTYEFSKGGKVFAETKMYSILIEPQIGNFDW